MSADLEHAQMSNEPLLATIQNGKSEVRLLMPSIIYYIRQGNNLSVIYRHFLNENKLSISYSQFRRHYLYLKNLPINNKSEVLTKEAEPKQVIHLTTPPTNSTTNSQTTKLTNLIEAVDPSSIEKYLNKPN